MKKYLQLTCAALLLIALTACAGANAGNDVRVKCPACGYEYNIDTKN